MDDTLHRLAKTPVPTHQLAGMDAAVVARVTAARTSRFERSMVLSLALFALMVGL